MSSAQPDASGQIPPGPPDVVIEGARGEVRRVHLALIVVQIAFATLAVEGKLAMSPRFGVSPHALAMLRILGAAAVFAVLHRALGTKSVRGFGDIARLAGLAFAGVVANQVLFLRGLTMTSSLSATLLVATIPVFAALVGAAARRDRLTARSALGIAIALVGIGVLSGFALPALGDSLVLLNSLSYSLYVVFAKDMLAKYGTITVIAWVFGLGALLFAPLGLPSVVREVGGWSRGAAALVAFIVLVPTVFAYAVNAWALRRASPTLVTVYIYLQPILVALLAWIQLGDPLQPRTVLAGVLILAGVGVVATARRQAAGGPAAGLAALRRSTRPDPGGGPRRPSESGPA